MRTAITTLIAAGVGAAAVSMMGDKRTRKRTMNMMAKNQTLKQMRKRMTRTFS